MVPAVLAEGGEHVMITIVVNATIAVASVLAWVSVVRGRGDDRSLMAHGLSSLKYYTVLSNLFSGAVSVVYCVDLLLCGGEPHLWVLALKLAAATVVMVTFLTVVLFLGPTMGWAYMFKAGNFWLHLVLPLAAAADVCLFVPLARLPLAATLGPVAFTAAYGAWYIYRVLRFGTERDGVTYDFYGFCRWGKDKICVVAAVMLAATWAIAMLLVLVNRLLPVSGTLALQVAHCAGVLVAYIVPAVLVLLPVRLFTKVPSFVFRKLLHVVAITCVTIMILAARSWQAAALTSVLIAVALHPLLGLIEPMPWYGRLFVEKEPGEIRQSLLMLFFMFAAVISVAWGAFGQPHLAAAAILMWGTGDAAAALVGIPFGQHKVRLPLADGKKSWEGSLAMLAVAFVSGLVVLLAVQGMPLGRALLCTAVGAVLGAATELFTPSKYDTVSVPVVIAAALLALA